MSKNMVLRTVLISPESDTQLQAMSFKLNKNKNDIIRGFVETGLKKWLNSEKPKKINK